MNFLDKHRLKKIGNLMDQGNYTKAIILIDSFMSDTTCIRQLLNQKCKCLLAIGQYEQALDLFEGGYPYEVFDDIDLETLSVLGDVYNYLGNTFMAEKFQLAQILFTNNEKKYQQIDQALTDERNAIRKIDLSQQSSSKISELLDFYLLYSDYVVLAILLTFIRKKNQKFLYRNEKNIPAVSKINFFIGVLQSNKIEGFCFLHCKKYNRSLEAVVTICSWAANISSNPVVLITDQTISEEFKNIHNIRIKLISEEVNTMKEFGKTLRGINLDSHSEKPYLLISEEALLNEINEDIETSKVLHMCYSSIEKTIFPSMTCLYLCNYEVFSIYNLGIDCRKDVYKSYGIDFSIIIPVRNTTKYLHDVIQTCLNQEFDGTYEILISDNSTKECNIGHIVESFSNSKIRYIKTPRDLSLAESFEFAYLNAHGDRLLSLGADDGLLPFSLSLLWETAIKNQEESVFLWKNAVYYWKDFGAKFYSNRILYESRYLLSKESIKLETKPLIRKIAINSIDLSYQPTFYLRTCIKREFIHEIIQKTGVFEDGDSQDIYTGYLPLFLRDYILYVPYPIAISGLSVASFGLHDLATPKTYQHIFGIKREQSEKKAYRNLINKRYRIYRDYGAPFGNYMLMYGEFLKVNRFNLDGCDYYLPSDVLNTLLQTYIRIPMDHCDDSVPISMLDNIAKKYGPEIFDEYCTRKRNLNYERKKRYYASRILNKSFILQVIYRKLVKNRRLLVKINVNGYKKEISGIFEASKLLSRILVKQSAK